MTSRTHGVKGTIIASIHQRGIMNFRKTTAAAGIAGALLFTSACSTSQAPTPGAAPSSSAAQDAGASPAATPAPPANAVLSSTLPAGIIAKGVANDGKGDYLQTSIADTDLAMKYNPGIADSAAKFNFSPTDLAEAQKVVVRFIAEEEIDSTLNGGTDVDGWWAAHKDQIHPMNQVMLTDLKTEQDILVRERWMPTKPGYSYVHGTTTPRVAARTITPTQISYVESGTVKGVAVTTTASWSMNVTGGGKNGNVQKSTGNFTFTVAQDPADGKWKIAGYKTDYNTAEG